MDVHSKHPSFSSGGNNGRIRSATLTGIILVIREKVFLSNLKSQHPRMKIESSL